jgi:hypothetical protein
VPVQSADEDALMDFMERSKHRKKILCLRGCNGKLNFAAISSLCHFSSGPHLIGLLTCDVENAFWLFQQVVSMWYRLKGFVLCQIGVQSVYQ